MIRECMCCDRTWTVPEGAGEWWAHIKSAEYEVRIKTPEARARIAAHWAEREAEMEQQKLATAGMLF